MHVSTPKPPTTPNIKNYADGLHAAWNILTDEIPRIYKDGGAPSDNNTAIRRNKKISYEAARQQVNRLRDELEGHIVKEGRAQYLDDLAVQILDERRPKHAVIVQDAADESQELKDLRARNEALLLKVTDLQEQLISKQEMIIQLQDQLRALEGSSTPPAAPAEDPPQGCR